LAGKIRLVNEFDHRKNQPKEIRKLQKQLSAEDNRVEKRPPDEVLQPMREYPAELLKVMCGIDNFCSVELKRLTRIDWSIIELQRNYISFI
jgi:hypothetical protein